MPFADASLTSIRDVLEVTYGTSPTGATPYKERRFVSEDLGQDKEVVSSDEIVPDRRNPDNIQVGSSASGPLVAELTGGAGLNDTLTEYWLAALGATGNNFSTPVGGLPGVPFSAGTITPTNESDPDDIKLAIGGGTPTNWPAWVAGDLVYFTGFTGVRAVFNTIFKVKSGGGTTNLILTAGPRVPGTPGTEPATNVGAFSLGGAIDGTVKRSFSIERKYSPITSEFALLDGMVITGFDIDLSPKRPVRVTFSWIGREETSGTVAITSVVTPAVTTPKSFSPVADLRMFALDEDGHSFFLNSLKLSFKNGAYPQDERAGNLGSVDIGQGTFSATGSWETYYENGAEFDKFQQFTNRDMMFALGNVQGFAWGFHLPRINWTGGRRAPAGKDQAIKGRLDFQAARGPAYLIKLFRI